MALFLLISSRFFENNEESIKFYIAIGECFLFNKLISKNLF